MNIDRGVELEHALGRHRQRASESESQEVRIPIASRCLTVAQDIARHYIEETKIKRATRNHLDPLIDMAIDFSDYNPDESLCGFGGLISLRRRFEDLPILIGEMKVILDAATSPLQPAFEEFDQLLEEFLARFKVHPNVAGIGIGSIYPEFSPDTSKLKELIIHGRPYPGILK